MPKIYRDERSLIVSGKQYLPFFRRLNISTAYEYLEKRFNVALRLFGGGAFCLMQLARMGIVLYLPAFALSTVTDFFREKDCIFMKL